MDFDEFNSDWANLDPKPETDFSSDAFEQTQLLRERRRLAVAERKKFDSKQSCLQLQIHLAQIKLEIEETRRAKAEAKRDLAREERLAAESRNRESEFRIKEAETREQAAIQMQRLVDKLGEAEAAAQSEYEKRMYLEEAELLDPQTADFLSCPECRARMILDNESPGRICPECGHRPARA
jgi:hypothetical protein